MMNKLKTVVVAMALLACSMTASADGLKVGMITTLSGGGSALGIDVRDGFMLAIEQSGRTDIEVVIEDDQRKPEIAVQIADKMVQSDKVDVLTGIIWSNLALAVVPSVVSQGKFYLSPNAGPSKLAGSGCHENYFNVAWQNDNLHEAAGGYANDAGYLKSFILAPNYPAGHDALTGYKRFFEGDIVNEVYTELGQKDYAAEIAQIRASGADSVFFFLPGGMGISFMKQYAGSGVDIPVIGPGFLLRPGHSQCRGRGRTGCQEHVPSGRRISTTPRMRPSSPASRKSTGACLRSMPRKGSTRPTSCFLRSTRPKSLTPMPSAVRCGRRISRP